MYDVIVLVAFTLVGIGGFFLGYGWASFIEDWNDS